MTRRRALSVSARLLREPQRFRFDAAVRALMRAARTTDPMAAARFRSAPGTAYPAAEVLDAKAAGPDGGPPALTAGMMAMTGPAGVLPRLYGDVLTATLRGRSTALHDFLDMLSHRMVGLFAGAAIKYRLHRSAELATLAPGEPERIGRALLAFTGYATPGLAGRLAAGQEPLQHYAGLFAAHPRSVDRLAALASDWLGRKVAVEQFAGAWLVLAPDQQTRMPQGRRAGAWNRLGVDAAIGVRAWDLHARVILHVGPLDRAGFEALLPDRAGLQRLVSLVRAFLGFETGFAINPILAAAAVPPLRLAAEADPAPRLGWNSWIPAAEGGLPGRRADAADALFEAEMVEAEEMRLRAARGKEAAA